MTGTAVIVDYGSGNIRSAQKALERAARDGGFTVQVMVSADPEDVIRADRIVLPGVGAFADCRGGLVAIPGMIEALHHAVHWKARPFLGICVGMQLLATAGHEHGDYDGFGWIPGHVIALEKRKGAAMGPDSTGHRLKIPHMGWNKLDLKDSKHPVLSGISAQRTDPHAYFVHSYCFEADDPAHVIAKAGYGGDFTAIVAKDTTIGTQFHPEKSQETGLTVLRNFLAWRP